MRRSTFFTPVPSVKRVVFISTPHGGSFISGGWIGQLTSKFITLPFRLTDTFKEAITLNPQLRAVRSAKDFPKSTDNMDPKSRFVQMYNTFPVAPGVTAHSIIPVKNPNDPKEKWNDGVVEYKSAHMEPVQSELYCDEFRTLCAGSPRGHRGGAPHSSGTPQRVSGVAYEKNLQIYFNSRWFSRHRAHDSLGIPCNLLLKPLQRGH